MVSYTTKEELRGFVGDIPVLQRTRTRKNAEERSPHGATFLSHSSRDDDLVDGAILILENHGATVYVDKIDPELPPYTSKETAAKLKTRINQSRKFVLLATKNSKESKWVPWELGLADGYKGFGKIALFPAVDARYETSWTSWEYMGLYDRIVWGKLKGYEKEVWMVLNEADNTATELSAWLRV